MYVDGYMLLAIYIIAVLALAISVYALWTLIEVEEQFKKKTTKSNNAWDHYHKRANEPIKVPRAKGHWD